MLIKEWNTVVKKAKKQSISLIYSRQTYAVYKTILSHLKLAQFLVRYFNILVDQQYFLER